MDSINAPDLQEIKTHRLAKESGQLDSLSISDNGRCVTLRTVQSTPREGVGKAGGGEGRGSQGG